MANLQNGAIVPQRVCLPMADTYRRMNLAIRSCSAKFSKNLKQKFILKQINKYYLQNMLAGIKKYCIMPSLLKARHGELAQSVRAEES